MLSLSESYVAIWKPKFCDSWLQMLSQSLKVNPKLNRNVPEGLFVKGEV